MANWIWWGRLFVVGVTLLIAFVPLTTNYFIFLPWLTFHPERNLYLWLGPFNLGILSIIVNYYLGVTTDPGRVPAKYNPLDEPRSKRDTTGPVGKQQARRRNKQRFGNGKSDGKEKRAKPMKPRWCKTCLVYKPPRSHHCSVCNRCVLKMDHHCPWLNNCIGHANQGHFLRFVLSVTFSATSCLVLLALRTWDLVHYQNQMEAAFQNPSASFGSFYTPPIEGPEVIFMILNLLILFLLLLTVGILSLYQIYYATQNLTTIESFENPKIEDLVRKGKIAAEDVCEYPYDLGLYRNLQAVLGKRWWLWWLPQRAPDDGIHFEVNEITQQRLNEGEIVQWPPKAYFVYKRYPHGKPTRATKYDEGEEVINPPRVRRGSEGYIVREWTAEERQRMLDRAMADRPPPLITIENPPSTQPNDPSSSSDENSTDWSYESDSDSES